MYQVVYIAKNVTPNSYPNTISPNVEADTVLEINANDAMVFGVDVGARVELDNK